MKKKRARAAKKKKKKQPKKQIDDRPILVVTSLGNSILQRDSLVFVQVGEKTFARKAAEDLREGEKVLFEKEGIDIKTHKERLDGILSQGRKYRNAMLSLFVEIEDGFTPRFRTELVSGAYGNPNWPKELSNEARLVELILRNNTPESEQMRELAAQTIHDELERRLVNARIVSLNHIRDNWLTGNVIAPRSFIEVFKALELLSPGLPKLLETTDFKQDYWMYRAMRQSISLRLSNIIKGDGRSTTDRSKMPRGPHLDEEARRELDEILDFFAGDISSRYAVASVVSTKAVKSSMQNEAERNKESLMRGIVTKKTDELDYQIISPEEIEKRKTVLSEITDEIMVLFFSEHHPEVYDNQDYCSFVLSLTVDHIMEIFGYEGYMDRLRRATDKMKKAKIDTYDFIAKFMDSKIQADGMRYAREIYALACNGSLDMKFGLEKGTVLKMFTTLCSYVSAGFEEGAYNNQLARCEEYLLSKGLDVKGIEAEKKANQRILDKKGLRRSFITSRGIYKDMIGQLGGWKEAITAGITTQNEYAIMRGSSNNKEIDRIVDEVHERLGRLQGIDNFTLVAVENWIRAEEKEAVLVEAGFFEADRKIRKVIGSIHFTRILKINKTKTGN
jgi:hypothetical protein